MNATTPFDYAELDAETRIVVKQRTTEIKSLMKRTTQDIIDIGQKLAEVKQQIPHGEFGKWLQHEFEWDAKQAQRFMNVAVSFAGKDDNLSFFAPSALYLLSAPSTPEAAREEAKVIAQSGEPVTHAKAKELVAAHKVIQSPSPQQHKTATAPSISVAAKPIEPEVSVKFSVLVEDDEPEEEFDDLPDTLPNDWEPVEVRSFTPVPATVAMPKSEPLEPVTEESSHPAGLLASAKSCEHYTPEPIWKAGLKALGVRTFDLDPASHAGSLIPCRRIYTKADDGLVQHWKASTLWSNFPYSDRDEDTDKQLNVMSKWVHKLCTHYDQGDVHQALTLVKSDCRPEWFHELLEYSTAFCFLRGSVKFIRPGVEKKGGSFFGSVVFYLGNNSQRFFNAYSELGVVCHEIDPYIFGE